MTMKRPRATLLLARLALAAIATLWIAPDPASADNLRQNLATSAARTANGTGSNVDTTRCNEIFVIVNVTAGSGTVSTFKAYLEASTDGGTTWSGLHCPRQSKRVASGPTTTFLATGGTGDGLIVNETAVVSAATTYSAACRVGTDTVRLAWEISGTTPSETFSADIVCK